STAVPPHRAPARASETRDDRMTAPAKTPQSVRTVRPSRRLAAIGGYAFDEVNRRVDALKARGISPIDFGVGDPTVPTPALPRDRVKTAVDERATAGYPAYEGDLAFREAIAAWTKRRFGVSLDPKTE